MNLSSLVVHARGDRIPLLRQAMSELPGVEVHAATADGRMVVTVEECAESPLADTLMDLQLMEGVLSISLAYHYCDNDLNEEASQ